jgi:diguanylate cyclase (GGDEF)-like protein
MTTKTTGIQKSQDIGMQEQRYSRMMQLLSLAMAITSIVICCLLLVDKVQAEIIAYVAISMLGYLVLFFTFRSGSFRAGFHGLIYLTSLNGVIGNTLIGWRSGFFILFFLLIPCLFYNPIAKKLEKMILCFVFGTATITSIILGFLVIPPVHFNTFQLQFMNGFIVLATCLILAGISYLDFRNSNTIASRLIDLNQQLAYQASRDSMTDLLNRRTMNQMIQMEYVRSTRSGKPFGLIMADVDDFKQVNDEYGHVAGDMVLTELSRLLVAALRKQDLTARWGGEEFLILLPETDFEGVQVTAEKIRDLVAHSSFMYQGKSIRVTLSIGGVMCQHQEDWDECIKHVDRALYYGKNHGKNLAIFSKGETYCILGDLGETF